MAHKELGKRDMEIPREHLACPRLKTLLGTTREAVFAGHLQLITGRPVNLFHQKEGALSTEVPPFYIRLSHGVPASAADILQAWEATPDQGTIDSQRSANQEKASECMALCMGRKLLNANDGRVGGPFVACGLDVTPKTEEQLALF